LTTRFERAAAKLRELAIESTKSGMEIDACSTQGRLTTISPGP
jgi:hypothetical protein